jgi:thiol:disulfide interchange protein
MKGLAKIAVLAMSFGVGASIFAQEIAAPKPPAHPYVKRHIYSETADPKADIAAALKEAKAEHKRVLLDFGGDWCGDCQVLDIYMTEAPNDELLKKHFIVVHVFIPSHYERNTEIAEQYNLPIHKGVPALAVLNANGKVLYSQQTGEFEDMRHMESGAVTEFLNRWKS